MIAAMASGFLILTLTIMNPSAIRFALAVPLILFLPGYGLTAVLFPQRSLDLPARLLLSVGMSLAIVAFSGLILHLTPWGISLRNPMVILLIGGPATFGIYSLVRDALQVNSTAFRARIGFNSRQFLLFTLAALIAATAVTVARTPSSSENLTGYTLLWAQAGNVPDMLEVGVRSEEFETTEYQLHFEINQVLREGPTFELKPGETWEYSLRLNKESLAGQPITILLYRLDNSSEAYRRVVWWYENN